MNFSGFDFDESVKNTLSALDNHGRIPHAIIIESKNKESALEAAKYLSMYVVCTSDNKPCKVCEQCHKAEIKGHATPFLRISQRPIQSSRCEVL